jgi:hypothetical protein
MGNESLQLLEVELSFFEIDVCSKCQEQMPSHVVVAHVYQIVSQVLILLGSDIHRSQIGFVRNCVIFGWIEGCRTV